VCDTSCIHVYFHALCYVIYVCDCEAYVTYVPSTLLYICHVTWLCSFALLLHFTSIQMNFTLCTRAYFISCEYIVLAWVI
jgi:hypothetical protein